LAETFLDERENAESVIKTADLTDMAPPWAARPDLQPSSYNPRLPGDGFGDGGMGGDKAKTTYSADRSIPRADARHCISELSRGIVDKLGVDFDAKELVKSKHVFPKLIKAFAFKLGLESDSQTNQDMVYFVHKHHG
jgi:hypothetical protein